jgi:hypothetical protein
MKKNICILFLLIQTSIIGYTQVTCNDFTVQQIQMDATQQNWEITIFLDADSTAFINYPFVALMVNAAGDTVAQGGLEYFGQFGQTTNVFHPSVIMGDPSFEGDIYFVYDSDTCVFNTANLGIFTDASFSELIAYPNPTSSELRWNVADQEVLSLAVYDAQGRCIHQGKQTAQIRVDQWPVGVYVYRLETSKGYFSRSFVIGR